MRITPATEALTRKGLDAPRLNVLVADQNNYRMLLLQPEGRIEADQTGIRSRDGGQAANQFGNFLGKAMELQADLVVTPEYSIPWNVLLEAITGANKGPREGKLWVLGCESIKYSKLQTIRDEVRDIATLLFEPMDPDENLFVDPLAYVFRTNEKREDGQSRLVVLVQFKTRAMADKGDLERNLLQLGNEVYQFDTPGTKITLTSFICSDAFGVTDEIAKQVTDRALILHLQLNPNPRHEHFLGCRERLLGFAGDETEVVCLNWASDVETWVGGKHRQWQNIAGSAWYGKMQEFDSRDSTLSPNHQRGLYYLHRERPPIHTLFLNFHPGAYLLIASKVARIGVQGAEGRRRGPQVEDVFTWDSTNANWASTQASDDGFLAIVSHCAGAASAITATFKLCPLACERLLALCAGNIDPKPTWFHPQSLDSFDLDRNEVIRRITFCQDVDHRAMDFRIGRLRRCARLWTILITPGALPDALKVGPNGPALGWHPDAPHQNLLCTDGERATVMYLGEDQPEAAIIRGFGDARERIRVSLPEEAADRAMQRVVLWYQNTDGSIGRKWEPPQIDRTRGESDYDFARMP